MATEVQPLPATPAPSPRSTRLGAAVALSLAAHLGAAVLLSMGRTDAQPQTASPPMLLTLVPPPAPPPPPRHAPTPGPDGGASAQTPAPATPAPAERPRAPRPSPPAPRPAPVRPAPPIATPALVAAPPAFDSVGPLELASAAGAGAGSGGGGSGGGSGDGVGSGSGGACDMIRRLQAVLRADADIASALTAAHATLPPGRALRLWDGDWVLTPGQDGKGLAGVRQAIAVEVAFAPRACRNQAVRGLVMLSLADRAGAPRVVLGTGAWRWGDLADRRR